MYWTFRIWISPEEAFGEVSVSADCGITSYEALERIRDEYPGREVEYLGEFEGKIRSIEPASPRRHQ